MTSAPAAAKGPATCKNCKRFTPIPFKHSFSAALEQTKNQSWQTNGAWIVTPTSSHSGVLANTTFCSGDCLFSCTQRVRSHGQRSNALPMPTGSRFDAGPRRLATTADLFSHDLLSNKRPDLALHFFKRTDEQRQYALRP